MLEEMGKMVFLLFKLKPPYTSYNHLFLLLCKLVVHCPLYIAWNLCMLHRHGHADTYKTRHANTEKI